MELDGMRAYLRYNHVGYACRAPKYFYIAVNEGEPFEVGADNQPLAEGAFTFSANDIDVVSGPRFLIVSETGEVAFEGNLAYRGPCKYSGETLLVGDFSKLRKPTLQDKLRDGIAFVRNFGQLASHSIGCEHQVFLLPA